MSRASSSNYTIGEVVRTLGALALDAERRADRDEALRLSLLAGEIEKALALHEATGATSFVDELLSGSRVILPKTREHAEAMLRVATLNQ